MCCTVRNNRIIIIIIKKTIKMMIDAYLNVGIFCIYIIKQIQIKFFRFIQGFLCPPHMEVLVVKYMNTVLFWEGWKMLRFFFNLWDYSEQLSASPAPTITLVTCHNIYGIITKPRLGTWSERVQCVQHAWRHPLSDVTVLLSRKPENCILKLQNRTHT